MKRWFCASLVLWLSVGAAAADDDWTGMWRINRYFEGKPEGTYHVRITADGTDRVTVYDYEARPMYLQSAVFEGDKLELEVANSAKQPLPLLFQLTRKGRQISGEWLFAQFQLEEPLRGGATGFQVFTDAEWEPWAEVEKRRSGRVIDLMGFLAANAPLKYFEEFEAFWGERVEAPYYFLVESWLYGDGSTPEQTRRTHLRGIFDSLSAKGPGRDLTAKFPEWANKTVELAGEATPKGFQGFLVSLATLAPQGSVHLWTRIPTPQEEADCACKIDLREAFYLIDPTAAAKREAGPVLLVKDMVRAALWQGLSPSIAIEVFRQALSFEAASGIIGKPLPKSDPTTAEMLRGMFKERLLHVDEAFSAAPDERRLAESLALGLGRDFVAWMRKKHSKDRLHALDSRDAMAGWIEYLTGEQVTVNRQR